MTELSFLVKIIPWEDFHCMIQNGSDNQTYCQGLCLCGTLSTGRALLDKVWEENNLKMGIRQATSDSGHVGASFQGVCARSS